MLQLQSQVLALVVIALLACGVLGEEATNNNTAIRVYLDDILFLFYYFMHEMLHASVVNILAISLQMDV